MKSDSWMLLVVCQSLTTVMWVLLDKWMSNTGDIIAAEMHELNIRWYKQTAGKLLVEQCWIVMHLNFISLILFGTAIYPSLKALSVYSHWNHLESYPHTLNNLIYPKEQQYFPNLLSLMQDFVLLTNNITFLFFIFLVPMSDFLHLCSHVKAELMIPSIMCFFISFSALISKEHFYYIVPE